MSEPNVVDALKQIVEIGNQPQQSYKPYSLVCELVAAALPIAEREAKERDSLRARVASLEACLRETAEILTHLKPSDRYVTLEPAYVTLEESRIELINKARALVDDGEAK